MNLILLRDRIRDKAKEACLTYSELETLRDINELINQTMPCMAWNYNGETMDFVSNNGEMTLDLYFLTNLHEDKKIETGVYERDYIVTEKNKIREYYKTFIKSLGFESPTMYLEVLRATEIPIPERLSLEAFLVFQTRVVIRTSSDICLDVEQLEEDLKEC